MEKRAVTNRISNNAKHRKNVFKLVVIVLSAVALIVTASAEDKQTPKIAKKIEPLPRALKVLLPSVKSLMFDFLMNIF